MGSLLDKVIAAAGPGTAPPAERAQLRAWAAGHDGHGHSVRPEIRLAAQDALDPGDEPLSDPEDWDESDWDDVRDYLAGQSPWFAKVQDGDNPGDPDTGDVTDEDDTGDDESALTRVIRLTPRTAEASTLHEPTVPPGGPGLFHMKGHQLPAYVQHLYKHLVGKYGKHRAYGVAIGIVKKWAEGTNPGGKGKGHHVHKDVQAAAARNVADWEKERAEAHAHHAAESAKDHADREKVAASALELVAVHAYDRMEHGRMERVNEYFKDDNRNEKIGVMKSAMTTSELRDFYRQSAPDEAQFRTHLREARAHYTAGRHDAAVQSLQGAQEMARKHSYGFTTEALGRQIQQVRQEKADAERKASEQAAETAAAEAKRHSVRGRLGALLKFAAGDELSPDELQLAAPAAWPSGKPYKQSFLQPQSGSFLLQAKNTNTGVIASTPGAKPIQPVGLQQTPSQTVSPGPPLPPGAKLPDPADVRKTASQVQDGADPTLAVSARKLLNTAAGKLESGDNDGALYALRGAQASLHSAYRAAYGANQPNTAKAFEVAGFRGAIPPAELSSARTAMLQGRALTESYRQVHHQVAGYIDAIRRAHFHGLYNGMPEARL